MVSVFVLPVYKIIPVDNSVMMVVQLRIAPEITPADIIGTVILINVLMLLAPKLMAASSMLMDICCKIAVDERMV